MSTNPDRVVIVVPPALAAQILEVTTAYARATGDTAEDCRRVVEIAILQRGLASMREQVKVEEETSRKMGWPTT